MRPIAIHAVLLLGAIITACDDTADSPDEAACAGADCSTGDDTSGSGTDDTAPVDDSITIAVSDLTTTAEFYDYTAEETTVAYFAVLDEDGHAHIAFDACDVCYRAGKGYRQEGDEMVCNNCGNRFAITDIGTENVGGGCWPGYLESDVGDEAVVIDPDTLEEGSWRFP